MTGAFFLSPRGERSLKGWLYGLNRSSFTRLKNFLKKFQKSTAKRLTNGHN